MSFADLAKDDEPEETMSRFAKPADPWHGFLPRTISVTIGATIGVVLGGMIAYEYATWRIEQRLQNAAAKVKEAADKIQAPKFEPPDLPKPKK